MFETKYFYIHNGEKSPEYRLLRTATRKGMEAIRKDGATYRVGMDSTVGRERAWFSALSRVRELRKKFGVGHVPVARTIRHGKVVDQARFFEVNVNIVPPPSNTPGVEGIDRWCGLLRPYQGNGSFRFAGICVCKHTVSGGHSDHADCAACDNFDTDAHMQEQVKLALANADYIHLKYVIYKNTIYFPDGSQHYYSDTHYHVHVSVYGGHYNSAC